MLDVHDKAGRFFELEDAVTVWRADAGDPLDLAFEVAGGLQHEQIRQPRSKLTRAERGFALVGMGTGRFKADLQPAVARERDNIARTAGAHGFIDILNVVAGDLFAGKLENDAVKALVAAGADGFKRC